MLAYVANPLSHCLLPLSSCTDTTFALHRSHQLILGRPQCKDARRANHLHGHYSHVCQSGRHHRKPAISESRCTVLPARVELDCGLCGHGAVLFVGCECAVLFPEPSTQEEGCGGVGAVPPLISLDTACVRRRKTVVADEFPEIKDGKSRRRGRL